MNNSLTVANILHDTKRYLAVIIIMTLSGLLIIVQLGGLIGYSKAMSEIQRQLTADLVIQNKKNGNRSWVSRGQIDKNIEPLIWTHPEVLSVKGWSSFEAAIHWNKKGESHNKTYVQLVNVDASKDSMTYLKRMPEEFRSLFKHIGAVIIPKTTADILNLKLGDVGNLGDVEVFVAGIVDGYSGTGDIEKFFLSEQTFALITKQASAPISLFLIRLHNRQNLNKVKQELNFILAKVEAEVTTPSESADEIGLLQLVKGQGVTFLGTALFAVVIGCGIAGQILKGVIRSQEKEFSTLMALGVKSRKLAFLSLEQSLLLGVVSIPFMAFSAFILKSFFAFLGFNIVITLGLIIGASVAVALIAILAGMYSSLSVFKIQPVALLR